MARAFSTYVGSARRHRHLPSLAAATCSRRHGLSRAAGPWSVACLSTVSDETAEADTVAVAETSRHRPISINGANGLKGPNAVHGNDVANCWRPPPELDAASPMEVVPHGSGRLPLPADVPPPDTPPPDTPPDVPCPTANGGYSHTASSRAKISAANKGKVPWNKGMARSAEVKARIAAGVRRRNRENFLAKLAAEGITEEEHDRRQEAARSAKEAERRRRRTAKGGYTPTAETRQKISRILKEKYASGEVTRLPRHPTKIRRGFQHSEETKRKISASLRKKWAEDPEYRDLMSNKAASSGERGASVRQRISATLKKRWEDPEFRASMLDKFANARGGAGGGTRRAAARGEAHRKKISEAMKRKWMDEAYRKRVTVGMSKVRGSSRGAKRTVQAAGPRRPQKGAAAAAGGKAKPVLQLVTPLPPVKARSKMTLATVLSPVKAKPKTETKTKRKKRTATKRNSRGAGGRDNGAKDGPLAASAPPQKATPKDAAAESISQLREERRDLYDLLYGDREEDELGRTTIGAAGIARGKGRPPRGDALASRPGMRVDAVAASDVAALLAEDDNLDDYDPYGLH